MSYIKICIALWLLAFATPALAILPVIDAASLAKMVELLSSAKDQIKQLDELSHVNSDQYNFLQKNLSGNFGYGNLFNNQSDLNKRQWSNDSWIDVLNSTNTGHASAFNAAQKKYSELYPIERSDRISPTQKNGGLMRAYYQQGSEISRATLAASSYNYDQVNDHIKKMHDMLEMLDKQTSEKASIDMNARLVAELGFIELEILRQQTFQNQLVATQMQGDVNGISDQAKFLQ